MYLSVSACREQTKTRNETSSRCIELVRVHNTPRMNRGCTRSAHKPHEAIDSSCVSHRANYIVSFRHIFFLLPFRFAQKHSLLFVLTWAKWEQKTSSWIRGARAPIKIVCWSALAATKYYAATRIETIHTLRLDSSHRTHARSLTERKKTK